MAHLEPEALCVLKLAAPGHAEFLLREAAHATTLRDLALPRLLEVGELSLPPELADTRAEAAQAEAAQAEGASLFTLWQYVPGVTADEVTLDARGAARVLRDVARGLARLHAMGLSHGDVKPANIRVDDSRACLLDLGLTAPITCALPEGGSPRYLPPDLTQGTSAGRDLYALGVTLIELLVPAARRAKSPAPYLTKVDRTEPLAEALQGIAEELLSPAPGRRPAASWLWRRAAALLGEPDPAGLPTPEQVEASYLWLRRAELLGDVTQLSAPTRDWAACYARLSRAIARQRARVLGEPEAPPSPSAAELTESGRRRWLLELIGPDAIYFPPLSLSEAELATRLSQLAQARPLAAISAAELMGGAPTPPPTSLQELALRLAGRVDAETLRAGEALVRLHDQREAEAEATQVRGAVEANLAEHPRQSRGTPSALERVEPVLRIALARALRRRAEHARAAKVLEAARAQPHCLAELSECHRRLGEPATARRLALKVLSTPEARPDAQARAAATLARVALAEGNTAEALRAIEGAPFTPAIAEARALAELDRARRAEAPLDTKAPLHTKTPLDTKTPLEAALHSLELGLTTAADEEDTARLSAVRGMIEHQRGDTRAAGRAFASAVESAQRAGALFEEASYLTGLAAAASDAGWVGRALAAAERAALIFNGLGERGLAARALLNQAAAAGAAGATGAALQSAEQSRLLAERSGDQRCALLAQLAYAALLIDAGRLEEAEHARARAEREAGSAADSSVILLTAVLRLRLGSAPPDALSWIAQHDALSRAPGAEAARLEWLRARLDAQRTAPVGRSDELLREAIGLIAVKEPTPARGQVLLAGARLALALSSGDAARRLFTEARRVERQLRRKVPAELLPSFELLPWVTELRAAGELGHLATSGAGALAADQLARLEQIIRSLSRRDSLRDLFGQILDALVLWAGVERGLLLLTAPGGALRIRAARGLVSGDLTTDQRALSMTLARRALARREPVVAVDAQGELPELSESVHALNLRSVLAAPLLARGEALGVVYLDDRDRRAAFGEAERAWVRLLASVAAIAIAEARDQLALRRAARRAERAATRLERELRAERRKPPNERAHPELVGSSPAMTQLIERIRKVAETELPVLILGESGTGKELVARAIHQDSARAPRALVVENCAAIPETLLESALFGHVRGAFTGADRARPGLFELANGGTLFLDEVGEMSLGMQAKLLRVLESGEVRAVGSSRTEHVDVRIIAATHRDLAARVREGSFREDLRYRLEVLSLNVPPLRERKEDIRELVAHFIARHPTARGAPARLSPAALRLLEAYPWPGNVRQLENELLRALVLGGDPLTAEHFSAELSQRREPGSEVPNPTLKEAVTRLQRRLLEEALTATHGNQSEAARQLGVSRYGLQKMLRRLETEDT